MSLIPGKEIACIYDQYGPVRVFDDGCRRHLSFGNNDEQSCINKAKPALLQYDYNRSMMLVMLLCQPKQALLLGLGGGSLCHCLVTYFPELELTVVELREAVIKMAKQYFALPQNPRLRLVNADALQFISELEDDSYDLLFSDLYIAEGLEARQLTVAFITQTVRVLRADGFLVMNALFEYRTDKIMRTLLLEHFDTLYERVTKDGNWVIIACNGQPKVEKKQLKQAAKHLSETLGFSLVEQLRQLD